MLNSVFQYNNKKWVTNAPATETTAQYLNKFLIPKTSINFLHIQIILNKKRIFDFCPQKILASIPIKHASNIYSSLNLINFPVIPYSQFMLIF